MLKSTKFLRKSLVFSQFRSFSAPIADILTAKTIEKAHFSSFDINDLDTSNLVSSFAPSPDLAPLGIMEKLSYLAPKNLYLMLDDVVRESILYIANDVGMGIGVGILGVALVFKLVFSPAMVLANLNGIKMKLIEPETKNFQAMSTSLSRTRDYAGIRVAREQFMELREKHKISTIAPLFSLLQLPFLMTLFLGIRYVCTVPDKYPEVLNGGFLWFKDLSATDPYGILPVLSSFISYTNIKLNPNMSVTTSATTFGKYMKYLKYMPFFSIPFAIFFPAGLNVYWCFISSAHLAICVFSRSHILRKMANIPEFLPGTILERQNSKNKPQVLKAVFADEKEEAPKTATTTTTEKHDHSVKSGEKGKVQVFLTKPKKKKI